MTTGFPIGKLTIIQVTGNDRVKIANNLCTQDVRSLGSGVSAETFITDVKGRTLSHGLMVAVDESLIFVSAPGQAERLVPHFDRYIIREDATIIDCSQSFSAWLFSSKECATTAIAPDVLSSGFPGCMMFSAPWIGAESVLVLIERSSQADRVSTHQNQGVIESDTEQRQGWELNRIEAFWPWYGVDIDDQNLPQEADIDARTISFKKGCYLGQETVARLDAMGKVQKKLVRLSVQGTELLQLPYSIIVDDKVIGQISSQAADSEGNLQCLAMMRRSHFEVGTVFPVVDRDAMVVARE